MLYNMQWMRVEHPLIKWFHWSTPTVDKQQYIHLCFSYKFIVTYIYKSNQYPIISTEMKLLLAEMLLYIYRFPFAEGYQISRIATFQGTEKKCRADVRPLIWRSTLTNDIPAVAIFFIISKANCFWTVFSVYSQLSRVQ